MRRNFMSKRCRGAPAAAGLEQDNRQGNTASRHRTGWATAVGLAEIQEDGRYFCRSWAELRAELPSPVESGSCGLACKFEFRRPVSSWHRQSLRGEPSPRLCTNGLPPPARFFFVCSLLPHESHESMHQDFSALSLEIVCCMYLLQPCTLFSLLRCATAGASYTHDVSLKTS